MVKEFRAIDLFVDKEKNIVIFPLGPGIKEDPMGNMREGMYTAYYPIELKYPYDAEQLAKKIEEGVDEWGKHPAYDNFSGKNTFEEKYYGIKGFKNAIRGKKHITIVFNYEWFDLLFQLPARTGYAYMFIEEISLPENPSYLDYAKKVIEIINTDVNDFKNYKRLKSQLLIDYEF